MKTKLFLIISMVTLLLTACNLLETINPNPEKQQITRLPLLNITQTPTPTTAPVVIQTPSCEGVYSFGNLIGVSPENLLIQPLTPHFNWYYNVREF